MRGSTWRSKELDYVRGYRLRKSFRDREVVRGATIKIEQGEVVGLLGPNGAGKRLVFI